MRPIRAPGRALGHGRTPSKAATAPCRCLVRPQRVAMAAHTASAPQLSQEAMQLVQGWLAVDKDPGSLKEVQGWAEAGDEDTIRGRLGRRLEFGTAGLRGPMGPGYNAMNAVVVQQTTQGLCSYLQQQQIDKLEERGVVIGYDGRYHSRDFAHVAAGVFLSRGIRAHLFSEMMPTPFVAAGVAELGAAAGIMVTASHNPMQDNGYKVYWGNGCQIIPPHDEGIAAAILANLTLWELPTLPHPLLSDPSARVMLPYYNRIAGQLTTRDPRRNATAQPVVYTPLHGVGAKALKTALQVAGLPPPHIVAAQAEPDPEFPTVVFPNPEEGAGTWELAFQEGRAQGSSLVIANDPDADRLAAAEADPSSPGGYRPFTGNAIGALLAHWLWTDHQRKHPQVPASDCVMLASVVSSSFLGAMAAKGGFKFEQTLTGFKWLGNRALELESQGLKVLFAYEEAIGFMPGAAYRDKDGIMSAVVFCEMAAELYARGTTIHAHLQDLYSQYGTPVLRSGYFIADEPSKSRAVFDRLREGGRYPQALGGHAVTWVRDLGVGLDTRRPDRAATLPWRAGDMMITYGVEGGAVLTVRASGTEPKLKWYLEVLSDDVVAANALTAALVTAVDEEVIKVDKSGLKRPKS